MDQNHVSHEMPYSINEVKETAIARIRKWLEPIYGFGHVDRAICCKDELKKHTGESTDIPISNKDEFKRYKQYIYIKIFTAKNEYTIVVHLEDVLSDSYMGAHASSRISRTGETWTRGNDLPDGKFSDELWLEILQDIVGYESCEIKSEKWKENYMKEKI